MAEDMASIEVSVKDIEAWKELCAVLKPTGAERLVYAAKRCAAMAAKLPAAQKRAQHWKQAAKYWRKQWRTKETLWRLDQSEFKPAWKRCERREKQANKLLDNWSRKASRISDVLCRRNGETLVAAAERVALMASEASVASPVYAPLVRRVEEAEAQATNAKARAASFERIANELQAQLNSKALETGRCSCGTALIDATAKGDKAVHDYCSTCQRLYPSSIKEYVDNFAKWSGMSMAKVEPHSEPPKEKCWE